MVVAEQAGVQMMKKYFKIEALKSAPQYGFRKGLKQNLLGRGCIDMLSWNDLTWDI